MLYRVAVLTHPVESRVPLPFLVPTRLTLAHALSHGMAPMHGSNLMRGFTPFIFAVTSDLDTQVARAVREGSRLRDGDGGLQLESQFVFTTFAGFRPAEACSISLVAMHQLLTQVSGDEMRHAAGRIWRSHVTIPRCSLPPIMGMLIAPNVCPLAP